MNYSLLKSRTFWVATLLVVFNFLTVIVPVFPTAAWISTVANLLGLILVSYFHVNPGQQYNTPPTKV